MISYSAITYEMVVLKPSASLSPDNLDITIFTNAKVAGKDDLSCPGRKFVASFAKTRVLGQERRAVNAVA